MVQKPAPVSGRTSLRATALLLCALALALGLLGWRAVSIAQSETAISSTATPDEARLTSVLATLVGPGHVDVRQSVRADGQRTILVLLDTHTTPPLLTDTDIETLIGNATPLDILAGDTVRIQRISFARVEPSLTSPQILELLALGGLCLCVFGALIVATQNGAVSAPLQHGSRSPSDEVATSVTASKRTAPTGTSIAARRINEDPQRAAAIVRGWLGSEAGEA